MLLSVYVSEYFVSYIIIDPSDISVKKHGFIKIPYNADYNASFLTSKKLSDLLREDIGELYSDVLDKIKITAGEDVNDINFDLTLSQVQGMLPINSFIADYTLNYNSGSLDLSKINRFENMKAYKIEPDLETRLEIDKHLLKGHVLANKGLFINNENFMIITLPIYPPSKRDDYMISMVEEFSASVGIAGLWKFDFDDNFIMLPLIAGLNKLGQDLSEFFDKNPMEADLKLIKAPAITDYEVSLVSKGDEKSADKKKFELNSVNRISFVEKDQIHLKWKGDRSKFDKIIYGARLGVLVDTNETSQQEHKSK